MAESITIKRSCAKTNKIGYLFLRGIEYLIMTLQYLTPHKIAKKANSRAKPQLINMGSWAKLYPEKAINQGGTIEKTIKKNHLLSGLYAS
jgi:hypothetical protein